MLTTQIMRAFSGAKSVAEMNGTFYVVYTAASREIQLTHELRAKGIDVYLPLVERRVVYPSGQKVRRMVPYLPRYVAICGDAEARYQAARSDFGVNVIDVRNQSRLVKDLQVIEAAIAFDPSAEYFRELTEGSKCRVKAGVWQGQTGILITRRPAGQNFVIYTSCFGQAGVPLDVDPDLLELCND